MDASPDHEGPVGAVPKPTEQHGQHQILISIEMAMSASTKRDIQVISQPTAKADVPATPKVLQARGKIRLPEVDHKMKPEQLRAAPRDAAVAAKIAIDLPGKSVHGQQCHRNARRAELSTERGIRNDGAVISNYALAE